MKETITKDKIYLIDKLFVELRENSHAPIERSNLKYVHNIFNSILNNEDKLIFGLKKKIKERKTETFIPTHYCETCSMDWCGVEEGQICDVCGQKTIKKIGSGFKRVGD